jgi:hypothetical protein
LRARGCFDEIGRVFHELRMVSEIVSLTEASGLPFRDCAPKGQVCAPKGQVR